LAIWTPDLGADRRRVLRKKAEFGCVVREQGIVRTCIPRKFEDYTDLNSLRFTFTNTEIIKSEPSVSYLQGPQDHNRWSENQIEDNSRVYVALCVATFSFCSRLSGKSDQKNYGSAVIKRRKIDAQLDINE
jgi:hypothetical protein